MKKFQSILSIALIPAIVNLIAINEGFDDISSMNAFYYSKTYESASEGRNKDVVF